MTTERLEEAKTLWDERNKQVSEHRKSLFKRMSKHLYDINRNRPQTVATLSSSAKAEQPLRVGIVGGGMAGLYAAMLLEQLGIDYHVFEASDERLGGRARTHYFNNQPHQYAELGAMRFPESWLQSRLFNFWDYLNTTANSIEGAQVIPRIPYILYNSSPDHEAGNLLCYNGMPPVTRNQAHLDNSLLGFDPYFTDPMFDYFKDECGKLKSAQCLLDAAIKPFMDLLGSGKIEDAWERVLTYDSYSARSYLEKFGDSQRPYPVPIVDYMETVLTYSGVYDLAFTELLLDNYSFDETKAWSTMDGGVSRLTEEMSRRIPQNKLSMGAIVFALDENNERAVIHYRSGGNTKSEEFDRVIVTLPFSILRFLDMPKTWSAKKYEAIRLLKMTNAVKVALGFKSRFWEKSGPYSKHMAGGQSNTNLPVRSIVYPSFGIGEPGPAYILASYCWQNDADKFAHLNEEELFELCLRDVVRLHGDIAREEYLGHGASVVWNNDSFAGGGFAFFAPGQFLSKFLDAREPEGRFHFAGEHLDMVHYWIAGAFNSAYRTVWEILTLEHRLDKHTMECLRDALGGGLILPTMIPCFGHENIEQLAQESNLVES